MADSKLELLIDIRSRLDELTKATGELSKFRQEATSTGQALKTGFGIEIARRGLDLLTSSVRSMTAEAFQMAGAIKDTAQNLGISTDAYQVLGNVIKDAGGDVGLLTMAVSNSNRSLAEARNVGSAAASAYRALGLDIVSLERLPVERRFEQIARAVAVATDKTAAFDAASKILGSRNLPTLLGALRELAAAGYGNLEEVMKRAGRVMEKETIERLDRAQKQIEKFKQAATIQIGEGIGVMDAILESAKIDFWGTAWDLIKAGPMGLNSGALAMRVARDNPPPAPEAPSGDPEAAAREVARRQALARAEYDLSAAIMRRQTVEADPNRTDFQKREHVLWLMDRELKAREKLIAAAKSMPLNDGETQEQRDLKLRKLEEENKQLRDQLRRVGYGTPSYDREQATRDRFKQFTEDERGTSGFNFGGSMRTGAMDWVTSLGTQGEQVSGALQSSLGATVQGISDGIYGWITGTMSFGEAMQNLGATVFKTIIDTIVQMGVQWLVTQALIKTGIISTKALTTAVRTADVVESNAAEAAKAPAIMANAAGSSIGSFGLAAVLGIAALLAAMAAFGGFETGGYTGDGPTHQVAGVVHGQEGVLNAPAMRTLGIERLNRLNAGVPLEQLAVPSVGRASAVTAGAPLLGGRGLAGMGSGGRESGRNVHVYLDRGAWLDAVQSDLRGIAVEEYGRMQRA